MAILLSTFDGATLRAKMLFANQSSISPWQWNRHGLSFHKEDQAFTLDDLSSEVDVALEKLLDIVGNENLAVALIDADEVEHALNAESLPAIQAAIAQARTDVQKCRHCGRRNP